MRRGAVLIFAIAISIVFSKVPVNKKGYTELGKDIVFVGVDDHSDYIFESQFPIPNGMAYNSYIIKDSEIAVVDTVDMKLGNEWFDNLEKGLKGAKPNYLIVLHMEPDHSANVANFMKLYPQAKVVSSKKSFEMMINYFGDDFSERSIVVKEGSTLKVGKHSLVFVEAPMVHWPEVVMFYDSYAKTLFSSDAFGRFGANDVDEPWDNEGRRYYHAVMAKFGSQVQTLLKKARSLDIQMICPAHGPILNDNFEHIYKLYDTWSSYSVETPGIVIAYTSIYGGTRKAVEILAEKLRKNGAPNVVVHDLARIDATYVIADVFRYSKLVLATTTYNTGIFPKMKEFIDHLVIRTLRNKTVGFMGNGSWGPQAVEIMKKMMKDLKTLHFTDKNVIIMSTVNKETEKEIEALANELTKEYQSGEKKQKENDPNALFNIGYGLYVVTSNDGKKDNGCIMNSVIQLTNSPNTVGVVLNKNSYSHHVIKETGKLNVNILNTETPFEIFKRFGFQSGRIADKFEGFTEKKRSENGLIYLTKYSNSFISLKVINYFDLGTHGMFVCEIEEAKVLNKIETMTYTFYQSCVKPRPNASNEKTGYACKICGFVYEGEILPDDYICPVCGHPAEDFEKITMKK